MAPRVVAAPGSLKGVLTAAAAAAAIRRGCVSAGVECAEVPVADGGEGTLDVVATALGGIRQAAEVSGPRGEMVAASWLLLDDGTAVIEAAQAIGLGLVPPGERRPLETTSRGVAELMLAAVEAGATRLLVGLGGTATLEAGAGLLELLDRLPAPTRVACDVRTPLAAAARLYGPQKGATPADVAEFDRRLDRLAAVAHLPGAGAAGGVGAALALLGAELVEGASLVLELVHFEERIAGAALAITGEGTVDATTWEGKAPAAVLAVCRTTGVHCVLFGGRVRTERAGVDVRELSGDPQRAAADLEELGSTLARELR